jgi:hypothetical protein
MADKESETRVDPELERQLDEAGLDDRPVQAVVYVRAKRPTDPTSVTEAAERAIEAAKAKAGTGPVRVNVMRYIGTVAVEGPASFVRALIEETDVTAALANVHPDDDPGLGKVSAGRDPTTHAGAAGDDPTKAARAAGRDPTTKAAAGDDQETKPTSEYPARPPS